ncbi:MAG: copper-binding protein [Acidobacteria bacterium]|nr:copper-binding protein [Acidobacteriota bacterium]
MKHWMLGTLLLGSLAFTIAAQSKRKPVATPTPVAGIGITPRPMGQTPATTPAPDVKNLPPKIYPLTGKVTAIYRELNTLEVEHDNIPDYMEAMTMKFPVKDPKLIKGLKVGDVIQARLHVSQNSGDWWLSDIRRKRK